LKERVEDNAAARVFAKNPQTSTFFSARSLLPAGFFADTVIPDRANSAARSLGEEHARDCTRNHGEGEMPD